MSMPRKKTQTVDLEFSRYVAGKLLDAGKSVHDVALAIDYKPETITRWLYGQSSWPYAGARLVAEYLNLDPAQCFRPTVKTKGQAKKSDPLSEFDGNGAA
jgi:cyanate lyase